MLTVFAVLLFASPSGAYAHGRVGSEIESDVTATNAEVVIKIALLDVLEMANVRIYSPQELQGEHRAELARRLQARLASRFCLLDSDLRPIEPAASWAEIPDFRSQAVRDLGFEQQAISLTFSYRFSSPPASLTFAPQLGYDHDGRPIIAQTTIKQDGQLRYLPTPVADMLPLRVAFRWDRAPTPIPELADLHDAMPDAQARTASLVLDSGRNGLRGELSLPLGQLGGALDAIVGPSAPADAAERHRLLQEYLNQQLRLVADGEPVQIELGDADIVPLDRPQMQQATLRSRDAARERLRAWFRVPGHASGDSLVVRFGAAPDLLVTYMRHGEITTQAAITPGHDAVELTPAAAR